VSNVADCGDAVALHIVDRAGAALAEQVVAVAQRLGMAESVNLSCIGGVFAAGSLLETALMKAIAPQINGLRLRPAHLPAVLGAVLLAWGLNGDLPSEERLARLLKSRLQGL
jgi:N-acetylglucosamine kinase-like BadF-type ATPase